MLKSLVFQHSVSVYLEFFIVNNYFSNLNLHISLIHSVESQLCGLFKYQLKIGRLLEIVHIFLARKIICIGIYTVSLTFMLNRSSEGADNCVSEDCLLLLFKIYTTFANEDCAYLEITGKFAFKK